MTNLEMTKFCAEAMGYRVVVIPSPLPSDGELRKGPLMELNDARKSRDGNIAAVIEHNGELILDRYGYPTDSISLDEQPYDPLHDDAQAMALVKKFRLSIWPTPPEATPEGWWVRPCDSHSQPDLNRAIVECVAKMQKAKT